MSGLLAAAALSFVAVLQSVNQPEREAPAEAAARRDTASPFQTASAVPGPGPASEPAATTTKPVAAETALFLVRSTLLALENANRTGNYSVLRELATVEFQSRNTAGDLARIFADLRRRGLDLTPAAVNVPRIAGPAIPEADPNGGPPRLRLDGSLNAGRQTVGFDLVFLAVDGQWRMDGLSIHAPQATASHAPAPM